ncbi:hypothetical protein Y032_0275g1036 [Ancylostoma ceylanicum]|uniref:Uncharacterized protein n=1 Tax=Ancylostoma ceylanicum TaxID=53326 RepID=A0A016S8G8_9BILA|nr:hypothetical protein Y032_0275g1036 [Ancylostoma ceylanicum]
MTIISSNGGEKLPEAPIFAIFLNIASFFCKFLFFDMNAKATIQNHQKITKQNHSCRYCLHETSSNCRVLCTSSKLEKDEVVYGFAGVHVYRICKRNWRFNGRKFPGKSKAAPTENFVLNILTVLK